MSDRFCSVAECTRDYYAKGFCKKHYYRAWKHGDPKYISAVPNGLAKRYPNEHRAWKGMKERCINPNCGAFARYGGRGVRVCDRWLGPYGFTNFINDMGKKPSYERYPSGQPLYSLDRVDNSGDYSPDNCRWATAREQTYNRSIAKIITINGETKTMQEWADSIGERYSLLQRRYSNGKRGEALIRPSRKWRRKEKMLK